MAMHNELTLQGLEYYTKQFANKIDERIGKVKAPLSERSDNLLERDDKGLLLLSEANMRALILDTIIKYHSDVKTTEFTTADGYSLITSDGLMLVQKETT